MPLPYRSARCPTDPRVDQRTAGPRVNGVPEPVLELIAVGRRTGGTTLLSRIDWRIDPGQHWIVLGPNGSGKTTLLRLCAGLIRPESGSATVLGHDLAVERRTARRRVALLGHANGLYDDLTVAQNMRFWARAAGLSSGEASQRTASALDRLAVARRLHDQPVHTLSAGQRRRTSLAALVVRRPELWLLDEPHAGLDQAGRDVVDALVSDAVAAGATVVVSSHELERVAALSPRVVTLSLIHI